MNRTHRLTRDTLLLFLLLTLFAVPLAMAGPHGPENRHEQEFDRHDGHHPACGLWRDPQLVKKLGLTDQQVTALKEADFSLSKKQLELKSRLDLLDLDMTNAFAATAPDASAVRELAKKMADLQGKLFLQRIESRLALATVLSPE